MTFKSKVSQAMVKMNYQTLIGEEKKKKGAHQTEINRWKTNEEIKEGSSAHFPGAITILNVLKAAVITRILTYT